MTTYTIKVSERVFYDVSVEADSPVEALRLVLRACDESDPEGSDVTDWPMHETDSGMMFVEPFQLAEYEANPEFAAEQMKSVEARR